MFEPTLTRQFGALKTPFFYYDLNLLTQTVRSVQKYGQSKGYHIHYALKANNNDRILELLRQADFGADCVSGREIEKAVEAGFQTDRIAFAGVGKTDEEIEIGLDHEIFSFNCESIQELEVINERAGARERTVPVALRINPNVEAHTHKYITTGIEENKFGIPSPDLPSLMERFSRFTHLDLQGIHVHIGSQIEKLKAFRTLCERINELQRAFESWGYPLNHVNVGGGLGISYEDPNRAPVPDFERYFGVFDSHLELRDGQELHFELGRSLVGQAGSLISRVLYTKEVGQTRFVIIDAGMTELIRPALYQAEHHIDSLTSTRPPLVCNVVGPICETSDTFRTGISLPELSRGDLLAIRSAGAYGQVMSSDYNLRERAPAYYSDEFDS